jgi:nicotinate dehydrogenase subunit A
VLVDGRAARACTIPLSAVKQRQITTLEGLAVDGKLHVVQQAFIDESAAQCGYCLNGMIIAIVSLLKRNPESDEAEMREALRYNLCRCGTHMEILAAARRAILLGKSALGAVSDDAVPVQEDP